MRASSFRAASRALFALLLVSFFGCAPAASAQRAAGPTPEPAFDPALYEGLEYRMVGPYRGGRATAVAGHPEDRDVYFQGSTGGGVWKTEDAGQTWTNITDEYFEVGPVGAIAIAPSDANVIYVGTGSACVRGNISIGKGVYKSTDGGKTWDFIGLPEAGQIGRIAVHPDDPDRLFVAALGNPFAPNEQRGVFRSTDGGDTWEKVLFQSDSTGAVDLAMNPKNPREIYAAMWRAERKPWAMISGAEEGGLYKSTDGGDTWTELGGGLPEGVVGKIGVTVSPADPDRVWAIIEAEPEGGVYRSDDAGKTWTRLNDENKLRQRAWYYTHIHADPQDPNTVYALNTGMYRSVDGGKTFERIRVPHGDVHDLWIRPDEPEVMVVGNDGGAQVSVTGGEGWSTMYNQPTAELYDVTVDNQFPYRLYGAQQDNDALSVPAWSSSGTVHPKSLWEYASGCETGPIALHPDHPETIWGGCYGGAINRMNTETGARRNVNLYPQLQLGQAARDLRHRFQWVSPIVVSAHDRSVVYHASQQVHRTTDGGMTWETISPDLTTDTPEHQDYSGGPINHDVTGVEIYNTVFALAESPHEAGVLWAGSDDGRVHITRDGGDTWTEITPDAMPDLGTVDEIDVSAHRAGEAYMAVHRYRLGDFRPYIFRTEDYGESWELLTDGTNGIPADHFVRTVREDPTRDGLLYAGTEFGVYVSFDDGERWQPFQLNLPVTPVTGMKVHRGDLVLSTMGRGFWILDELAPVRQLNDRIAAADAHLFQPSDAYRVNDRGSYGENAPERRAHGVRIDYRLADEPAGPVDITILDADGRTVRTFTSDSATAEEDPAIERIPAEAGMHRVAWDLTYPGPDKPDDVVVWGYTGGVKAPPGEYTVRLAVDGTEQTRSVRVQGDPRIDVAQESYRAQFEIAVAVRDSLNRVYDALRRIGSVTDQVDEIADRIEDAGYDQALVAQADTLASKLTAVERKLTQTKSESGQDPIRFPGQLDNQYVELYGYVTGTDGYIAGGPEGRPGAGAYERFSDLNAEWAPLRDRLRMILENDLVEFNAALERAGVPAIFVPGAVSPTDVAARPE